MKLFIEGYSIEKLISQGGFAGVYRAKRAKDRKIIAIKVLTPQATSQFSMKMQFYTEAKLLAQFDHPYIIRVHGLIKDAPRPALAMEYFESDTLKSLILKKSPLIETHGLGIFRKIAESLKYLHDRRIIHKDIKPENILVSQSGDVRLIDFSIAEKMGLMSYLKRRTREGTPLYMAPEQIKKQRPDYRTDVFSLGATFYEAFAGQTHITAVSDKALLQQQLRAMVGKIRHFNKKVPYQVDNIIMRMLKKKQEERYQSMAEVLFDLNKFSLRDNLVKPEDQAEQSESQE